MQDTWPHGPCVRRCLQGSKSPDVPTLLGGQSTDEMSQKVLRLCGQHPEGYTGCCGHDSFDLDGDRAHKKNKEKLTRRLEIVGLRYGMRVDLEGKKACQSMSQRDNWGEDSYKSCYVSYLQL